MLAWHFRDRLKRLLLGEYESATPAPQPAG
jgi:hypothetical protein